MRQAVNLRRHSSPHSHSFRFSLPFSSSAQILPESFRQGTYANFNNHTDVDRCLPHRWLIALPSGQFSFRARPWHLSDPTVATTNLPTWRLLKVLYVLNTRYETMFLLQFELPIISSCNYLALRTDLSAALPTSILSIPGSKAASSSVTST